jgi:heme-degrading monooxygenase HmoA
MHTAVRRYEGVTDTKEVVRQVEEHFLPIISEMPGFVAYYLVDAGDGVMVSTSIFEHQAAEEQSSWKAGQFTAEHIASLSPNPPQITAGDVAAHKSS